MEIDRTEYIDAIVKIWVYLIKAKFYTKITLEEFNNLEEKIETLNLIILGRKIFDGI